jgi:site-specific DNA recombinase
VGVVERSKAKVATVQSGAYDLTTPGGRMTARIIGAVAQNEVELKAERQRSKYAELARAGKPSGGGSRPFGYGREREVYEPEAALVRQAA